MGEKASMIGKHHLISSKTCISRHVPRHFDFVWSDIVELKFEILTGAHGRRLGSRSFEANANHDLASCRAVKLTPYGIRATS